MELYNLQTDRGESKDLAPLAPEEAAKLKDRLLDTLKKVEARMPEGMISRKKGF